MVEMEKLVKNLSKFHCNLAIISTSLTFFLISISLIAVNGAPTSGYESSIYLITPSIFWVSMLLGIFNSICILNSCTYSNHKKMWHIAYFQLIFINILILSLYSMRGYVYLERCDTLTYMGLAIDILNKGVCNNNLYPFISLLLSQISLLSNISILGISKFLPSLFSLIYLLSIYNWSKSIIDDDRFFSSCVIASCPIFFAWFSTTIYHMLLSILFLPIFFYCIQRNSDYRFRIISIILGIVFPFFHPITAIMLLIFILTIYIFYEVILNMRSNISLDLILFYFISLCTWFISQYILMRNLSGLILQIIGSLEITSSAMEAQSNLEKLGLIFSLKTILLTSSDEIVYFIISILVILYLVTNRKNMREYSVIVIGVSFFIGNFLYAILFLFSNAHSPIRLINLNANMVFAPILVGYALYNIKVYNIKYEKVLITLIMILFISCLFSLYQSPFVNRPNDQVTLSELSGTDWLIKQKNTNINTAGILTLPERFADMIYGHAFLLGRRDLNNDINIQSAMLQNGNYLSIPSSRYLILSRLDIEAYTNVWKELKLYTKESFTNIDNSRNILNIYNNGGLKSFLIIIK